MRFLVALALLTGVAHAQPVPGASATTKAIYALAAEGTDRGALSRTEIETYGPDGRRLRVEWRAPDGTVTLTYLELYAASDRPIGAVYFEGDDLSPTLEAFAYRDTDEGGTVRRVTYSTGDGTVTGVNAFVTDSEGREVERRYGVAEGAPRAIDTITYDGPNATGYVYTRTDGSARTEYTFRVETADERGNWTSRTTLRDGVPRALEVREIRYTAAPNE